METQPYTLELVLLEIKTLKKYIFNIATIWTTKVEVLKFSQD